MSNQKHVETSTQPHFPTRPLRQPEGLNYPELFALTLDTWLIILGYVTVPGE